MEKKMKKQKIRVDSQGIVEEVVADHNSMEKKTTTKKKKFRENAGEDGEIAAAKSEKFGEDDVVEKKSKKRSKEMKVDSEADDEGVKKSKKKHKKIDAVSEADGDGKKKKKKKSGGDEIRNSEEGNQIDSNRETGKRKRDDTDVLRAETERKSHKKKKKKKMKPSVDSEVEETSLSSAKDSNKEKKKKGEDSEVEETNLSSAKDIEKKSKEKKSEDTEAEEKDLNTSKDAKKKKKKKSVDSEVEENNKDSTKDANKEKSKKKKKQREDIEAEEKDLNSTKEAKKKKKKKQSEDSEVEEDENKKKKKKKKKQSEDSEVEEDANKKKKKKKKQECSESDKDVTTPSSKSSKKVKFSDKVEIFPSEDEEKGEEDDKEEEVEEVELVRGKRFTKEEDALLKQAVLEYIDNHALGDEGLQMVLQCKAHPQIKGCWKEIASALPWRPYTSIYYRAHTVFEEGSKGVWTEEDLELVKEFQKKHGNDWRTLGDAMGKHRIHVKDAWRRIRLNMNKGHWSREEYQSLFDLVNKDIRMKAFKEKHAKHGMLRDNIPWMAISDELGTRNHTVCCLKWYDQLVSPMVAKGIWANVDDYRLLEELMKLDAACIDDVEWDNLLESRDGEACRKRWNQMVQHIGTPRSKTFAEQVEILSERYCPELAEDREDFDNRPYDPED